MVMAEDAAGNRSQFSPEAIASIESHAKGMIAHYPFDDSANDESENGFYLRLYGSLSYRNGVTDDSKCANIRNLLSCQLPYSALASDEFSVALWFRVQAAQNYKCLFSTGLSSSQALELYPYSSGSIELRTTNGEESCSLTAPSPYTNEWHHIAIVVSEERAALYVNGSEAEEGDAELLRRLLPTDRPLTYLAADISHQNQFAGFIDDMRIFNKALSPDEVTAIIAESSGIDDIFADGRETAAIEYYSPSGIRLSAPADNGITIVKTIFSDGSSKVRKLLPVKK